MKDLTDIVICGSNRSGTSLLARCFYLLGYNFEKDLITGDNGNIYGYYESQMFKKAVEGIIKYRSAMKPFARHIFKDIFNREGYWVWKYPKAVRMLDTLAQISNDMKVVYMSRPEDQVILSMVRHAQVKGVRPLPEAEYKREYDYAEACYLRYRGEKIQVEFSDLLKDPVDILYSLSIWLYNDIPYEVVEANLYDVVDRKEVHF